MHGVCLYLNLGRSWWSVSMVALVGTACLLWVLTHRNLKMVVGWSWQWVSVVTTLKENIILNTKLLSRSIYVHVLVTFVVTFSRSNAYRYCYCMLDCRWPYSPEKIGLNPFPGKRKGIRVYRGCCKCWMCLGGFSCCMLLSRLDSQ